MRRRIESIVVLKLDHIGDFVLACDAFADLRNAFADARITLVCDPAIRAAAESLGIFDEVVAFQFFTPRGMGGPGPLYVEAAAFAGRVAGRHDLAVDLRHDAETRPLLAHVDARIRAGYEAPGLGVALDFVMPRFADEPSRLGQRHAVHAATRMRLLVQALVATLSGHREPGAVAGSTAPSPGRSDYFAMAPGSGVTLKNWSAERFAELGRRLATRLGKRAVIVGGRAEVGMGRDIAAAIGSDRATSLVGIQALPELRDTIRGAGLFVGNDTGATHLAGLLGVPTVCVFSGVADVRIWGPRGPFVRIVRSPQPCSPCYANHESQCVANRACTRGIEVREVLRACRRVLQAAGAGVAIPG